MVATGDVLSGQATQAVIDLSKVKIDIRRCLSGSNSSAYIWSQNAGTCNHFCTLSGKACCLWKPITTILMGVTVSQWQNLGLMPVATHCDICELPLWSPRFDIDSPSPSWLLKTKATMFGWEGGAGMEQRVELTESSRTLHIHLHQQHDND